MAVKVKISIAVGDSKIKAIVAWRLILSKDEAPAACGLTESKTFIETKDGSGMFEVIFSDAQFGRFVVASQTTCSGAYQEGRDGWSRDGYLPSFRFGVPETYTPQPKILDFTA